MVTVIYVKNSPLENDGNILQVLFAGSLLKNNRVLHDTLISAMSKKATVVECIEAIEKAE